jgi:hypothetical protein
MRSARTCSRRGVCDSIDDPIGGRTDAPGDTSTVWGLTEFSSSAPPLRPIPESGPLRVLRGQSVGQQRASERRMPPFEITPQLLVKDASANLCLAIAGSCP